MAEPARSVDVAFVPLILLPATRQPGLRNLARNRPPPMSRHLHRSSRRLHAYARRTSGPHRSGRVLDRRRHAGHHGRVVDRDRHLFRIPRGRADPPDRPPGRDAIRLRGPHRRIARAGRSHHQPAIARPGAIRAKAQRAVATAGDAWSSAPSRSPAICRRPARSSRRARAAAQPRRKTAPALADQRHRDLHRTARPRGAA